ncbi:MAG: DUF1573 domain-containing protein [Muribaculaceae bacterium]|nr:DUF1573 domain-containing protein [Muribaculaceae bacterium]
MSRYFLSVTVLLSAVAVMAGPRMEWIKDSHDFGVFREECGIVACEMQFVNTGDSPVVITDARATCGCTTPEYPESPVAPGDTATVTVSYNALGRPGRFNKKVYLYTNTEKEKYTLTISGVVIGDEDTVRSRYPVDAGELKLRNSTVAFGELKRGKIKTVFLDAYNQGTDTLYPEWKNVPEYLSILSAPEAVASGEQITFSFYLNTGKCPQWGLNDIDVTLIPTRDSDMEVPVLVVVTVEEDFSRLTPGQLAKAPQIELDSEQVDFGTVSFNSGIVSRRFEIGNTGKSPLEIRRIYTADPGVTIRYDSDKIKKGKTLQVTVDVDTSKMNPELLNARITVITNDPYTPRKIVRVVGEVKQ